MDTITLSFPARPEFLALARSLVASAAAQLPITYDEVDDLRMATTEAVGHLMIVCNKPDALVTILISSDPEAFEVVASLDCLPPDWPPASPDALLTWQILTGLVDAARFDTVSEHAVITFKKSTTASV